MERKEKVLVVTKDLKLKGGVTNFYRVFFRRFDADDIDIENFVQGERGILFERKELPVLREAVYLLLHLFDLSRFSLKLLLDRNIGIVHLNPSLIPVPLRRDSHYLRVAKALGRKVVVLYHGWDGNYHDKLAGDEKMAAGFRKAFGRADASLVLSGEFKTSLEALGIQNVHVTRTMFDGRDLIGKPIRSGGMSFFFLGRLERSKGIFEIADAVKILRERGREITVDMAGWFSMEETEKSFREKLESESLSENVRLRGYVSEEEKKKLQTGRDIFLYPSWYFEGCPTVVMEAIGAGQFIISTDVAALKEVVKDGVNGFIIARKDPDDLADKISKAMDDPDLVMRIRKHNRKEAMEKYEASAIIGQIVGVYRELLHDRKEGSS